VVGLTLPSALDCYAPRGTGQVLLLDNRDSFTFNLAHRLYEVGVTVGVVRSDAITLDALRALQPRALVISPGPGHPRDAGISVAAIQHFSGAIPILGVCLGHQAIGLAFGGIVEPNHAPLHGRASLIDHTGADLFEGVVSPMEAARYHSLVVREPLPDILIAQAWCDGFVMALRHRHHPTFGLQFHPESILTPDGLALLARFAALCEV
jgi:anthranilate synthase/aminodeoxychorismate synthase-like glutamine amidotransferase